MRFEQLKHTSNTIVRKKLYKSGKNWVVMSSLAFIGGLVLLGSSQINTVKADAVSGSDVEQQQPVNADATKVQNSSTSQTDDETTDNTEKLGQDAVTDGNTTQPAEKSANASEPTDSANDKTPATTSGNITATADKSTEDTTPGNIDSGDGWRIDSNHALHFTSSNTELSGDPNNGWQADQYHGGPDAITSISFDDKVTAGSSLNGLFQGLTTVKSISGFNNLDTSKTTDFSSMFVGCQNLETADVSTLNTSAGTNFSDMFASCSKLQSVDISKWDLSHGTNFIAMFAGCTALKSIDLSNWDMSKLGPANYGGLLGGTTSLESLKLGSKDKLDGSIGLQDPETSDDSIKGGWTSYDYKTTDNPNGFYNSAALEGDGPNPSLYDGVNGKATTWQTYPKFVNFKVQYVDDSDPKNPITYTDPTTYSARAGSSFSLNQYLPGYQMIDSDQDGITGTVPEENNGVLIHKTSLVPYAPVTLEIQESYLDGKKTKVVQIPLTVYTPLTDYDYSSQLLNDGIEWDNVSKDDSKVLFGVPDGPSVTDVIADFHDYKIASVNDLINVVTSHSIESPAYGPESLTLVNPGFTGETFEFKIVYKKGGAIPTNSGGSNPAPAPTITDLNQNVATFGDRPAVQVYDTQGNEINETVAPNFDWHSDKQMSLNGITYYSLDTDKWVKDTDAYVFFPNKTDVRTYQGNYVQLTDGKNGKLLNRALPAGTDWYTDRIAMLDGEKYYRVSTSEFVKATAVYEYKTEPRVVQINKDTVVYDELGNTANVKLPFSEYKSDITVNINGKTYYRIATNLFVRADNI